MPKLSSLLKTTPAPAEESDKQALVDGSIEAMLAKVRVAVLDAAVPCRDGEIAKSSHRISVEATYPEHAFVHCSDCDTTQRVYFSTQDGEVVAMASEIVQHAPPPLRDEIDQDDE